jgi:hypothetical protein
MNWKASLKAAAVGTISGTAIGLIAFFFLTSHQHPSMGAVLFLLVPVAAGFSVVLVARVPNSAAAAALLSVVCSLVLLVALGKEGVLCAILAFPIIVAGLAVGAGIGVLGRKLASARRALHASCRIPFDSSKRRFSCCDGFVFFNCWEGDLGRNA